MWEPLKHRCLTLCALIIAFLDYSDAIGEVIYAVNCGGEAHTDSHGIHYQRDPLHGKVGTASDFGKQLIISRVPPADQILYQTERYHYNTFGYDIPFKADGDYVLVLKFSEVYFTSPKMKIFSISLNNEHTVVSDLDIFEKVGRSVAHDEHVPFTIQNGKLKVNGEESNFVGRLRLDFIKGYEDNPKINAIYVMKGTLDDVPKLPSPETEEDFYKEERTEEKKPTKIRRPSGPKTPDPYSVDDSSLMLPVFVAIGAFIPVLFCLCKL
uniref:Malectin domain-containing protein n=1 Tax=Strigamia maritima TaxID=126957 RepID=T1IK58_STRMM